MFSLPNVHSNAILIYYRALTMIPPVKEPKLFNSTPNSLASQVKPFGFKNKGLSCHNNKLLDDNEALQNFGVRNNSQVCLLCSAFKLILYLFSANSFSLH